MNWWTHTSRGRALELHDPRPEDVDLDEVGMALGNLCRYNGCVRRFYSVAEHSVLLSRWLAQWCPQVPQLRVAGLLHDAAEAYMGDLSWPMQGALFDGHGPSWSSGAMARERYHSVQGGLERAICAHLDFDHVWLHVPEVRLADLRILLDEREVLLLGRPRPWLIDELGHEPLGVTIEGWTPSVAHSTWARELIEAVHAWDGTDLELDGSTL